MISFIAFLLVGLLAGWLSGKILQGHGFGLLPNLLIGVVGSFLGAMLFRLIGFRSTGIIAEIIVAVVGSVLLLYLIGMIKKG